MTKARHGLSRLGLGVLNKTFKLLKRTQMKKTISLYLVFLAISYCVSSIFDMELTAKTTSYAGTTTKMIKFTTLAPEGSTWTNVIHDIDKELEEKSGGKLRLKVYAGGVSGDEKDVIRKMRIGQLHSAGFTGVGLGEILPEVRILDLPFFFSDY